MGVNMVHQLQAGNFVSGAGHAIHHHPHPPLSTTAAKTPYFASSSTAIPAVAPPTVIKKSSELITYNVSQTHMILFQQFSAIMITVYQEVSPLWLLQQERVFAWD